MRRLILAAFVLVLWLQVEAKHFQIKVSRSHVPLKSHRSRGNHHGGKRHRGLVMKDVYGSNVTSAFFNIEYKSSISLGTPAQVFTVIMDTGSHILWVPHKGCTNKGQSTYYCPDKEVYDEKKSSTAKKTKDPFKIVYGIGSTDGIYVKDVFAFGSGSNSFKLKTPITFGVGDKTIDGDQGVLGLSYSFKSEKGTSIFQQMLDEKKLDHPLFTVFYKRCPPNVQECADGGLITFGKHDRTNCGPILGWTPMIDQKDFLWKFTVDQITVGAYTYSKPAQAITDTGTSHFRVAKSVYKAIIAEVGGTEVQAGTNLYKVPCNKTVEIKVKINGVDYTVPMDALVVELANNECQLQIADREEDDVWILGDPWIRAYCQIHNWQERKVGFAKPGPGQSGEEYTPPPTKSPPTTTTKEPPVRTPKPPRNPGTSQPECKDTSRSCFNWNRNGFCTMTFFPEERKQQLCAKTCNKCPPPTNPGTNLVSAAARRRRQQRERQRKQRERQQKSRQHAKKDTHSTGNSKNAHQTSHHQPAHKPAAHHQNTKTVHAHSNAKAHHNVKSQQHHSTKRVHKKSRHHLDG